MPVQGADIVAKNIIKFGGGFLAHVNQTMNHIRFILDQQIGDNMKLTDHGPDELRRLQHPYATRWGTSKASDIHQPYWLVHKQSGNLLAAKFSGNDPANINGGILTARAFVGLDRSVADYASFVIFGTSKMIPRPLLQGSLEQVKVQAKDILKKELKNFVVNFHGDKEK